MRVDHKVLVLGMACASAMSVLAAGCSNRDESSAPAATTSVGTQIDDTVVTSKVKSALFADPDIKSFDLKVETRKGKVQLSGFVANQAQIDRAIGTTRRVEGVKSVENALSLKGAGATVGNTLDD